MEESKFEAPQLRLFSETLFALLKCFSFPIADSNGEELLSYLSTLCDIQITAIHKQHYETDNSAFLPLLRSINHLLLRISINYGEFCRLTTSKLHTYLLKRYELSRNERTKDEIIIFFRIQMRIFLDLNGQPMSFICESKPSDIMSENSLEGQNEFMRIYEKIIQKYWESPDRHLQSSSRRPQVSLYDSVSLPSRVLSLLDLGADLIFRLTKYNQNRTEVTPSVSHVSDSHNNDINDETTDMSISGKRKASVLSLPPIKRRRIQFSAELWGPILSVLESIHMKTTSIEVTDRFRILHLLHLLTITMRKYPFIFDISLRSRLQDNLLGLLLSIKDNAEIETWALYCLAALASSSKEFLKSTTISEEDKDNLSQNWKRIWSISTNRINTSVSEAALRLMTSMMEVGVIDTQDIHQDELWKIPLFESHSYSNPIQFDRKVYLSALHFVSTFLSKFTLVNITSGSQSTASLAPTEVEELGSSQIQMLSGPKTTRERLLEWVVTAFHIYASQPRIKISTLETSDQPHENENEISRMGDVILVCRTLLACVRQGPPKMSPLPLPPQPASSLGFLPLDLAKRFYSLTFSHTVDLNAHERLSVRELRTIEVDLETLENSRMVSLTSQLCCNESETNQTTINHFSMSLRTHLVIILESYLTNQVKFSLLFSLFSFLSLFMKFV
jgi:hypothetical protein